MTALMIFAGIVLWALLTLDDDNDYDDWSPA